mmetsp:Transcript_11415/g.19269  ORF Transcript_11415/g.19269 Transcript_11415/m.19269 type:complete len:300 (-) Transcript_11415:37-936(-)
MGSGVVADVLRGMEYLEGQSVQELSLGEQASYWFQSPPSLAGQILGDVVQLGDGLGSVPVHLLLHVVEGVVGLFAPVLAKERADLRVAEVPYVDLVLVVVDAGDLGVAHLVPQRRPPDVPPPFHVLRVLEARVVDVLDAISLTKHFLSDVVEVTHVSRKPRNFDGVQLLHVLSELGDLAQSLLHVGVGAFPVEVDFELEVPLVLPEPLLRPALDAERVDLLLIEDIEHSHQRPLGVGQGDAETRAVIRLPEQLGHVELREEFWLLAGVVDGGSLAVRVEGGCGEIPEWKERQLRNMWLS